nr:MAG TPA: hypothetical protein [Caudoviricetes sp.]
MRPRPEGRGRRGTISFSSGNAWPTRRWRPGSQRQ